MPLFRRPDGILVKDLSPERAIMPYLMRGRNESAIYYEAVYDVSKLRPWLRDYNRAKPPQAATLFHLFLWACAKGLHEFPGMNRFVSGGRLYQRKHTEISFTVKRTLSLGAPLVAVKVPFPPDQSFRHAVNRVAVAIHESRAGAERAIDKELQLALLLPRPLLRGVMACLRSLDRLNLLPNKMLANDPMHASMFVANLGSIGLSNTFHHLYEYGTVSIFAAIGTRRKAVFISRNGTREGRDDLQVRWTLDERIADGHYAAYTARLVQSIMEDPERYLGKPEDVASATNTLSPLETA